MRTADFQVSDDNGRHNMVNDFDLIFYNSGGWLNVHVEHIPIITETYVAIMSKQHPLSVRESLSLAELASSPFVAYHRKEIDQTYQFCMEAGFTPNIAYETDNVGIKPHLINIGAAVGIIPEICIVEYKTSYPNIAFVPIAAPLCKRTVYLGWKNDNYLTTQEGKMLPVSHCIEGTQGHLVTNELDTTGGEIFDKPSFGSLELAKQAAEGDFDEIELCGVCTDICVVSNALILKAQLPETKIVVDAKCCAGVTEESHDAALLTMKMCQVNVIS